MSVPRQRSRPASAARPLGAWAAGLAIAAGALGLAGCGSATFTAEELVAEVNRHGGGLGLGEPLAAGRDGAEIHTLTLSGRARAREDSHAAGTLLITAGDDVALAEYRRCESAASLICFRAANAVLVFADAVPRADLVRLGRAIRAMASD